MPTKSYTNNTLIDQVVENFLGDPLIAHPGETVTWEIPEIDNAFSVILTISGEISLSGASSKWAAAIPDGAVVIGLKTEVVEQITGSGVTGYKIGDGSEDNRWGDITGIEVGTKSNNSDWNDPTVQAFISATDIVVTAKGGVFTGGRIKVVLVYAFA